MRVGRGCPDHLRARLYRIQSPTPSAEDAERVREIEDRKGKISPTPWQIVDDHAHIVCDAGFGTIVETRLRWPDGTYNVNREQAEANTDFIAHAPADVDFLLGIVKGRQPQWLDEPDGPGMWWLKQGDSMEAVRVDSELGTVKDEFSVNYINGYDSVSTVHINGAKWLRIAEPPMPSRASQE